MWTVRVDNATGLGGAYFDIAVQQASVSAGKLAADAKWQVQSRAVPGGVRVLAFSSRAEGLSSSGGALLRLTNVRGTPRLAKVQLCDAAGGDPSVR